MLHRISYICVLFIITIMVDGVSPASTPTNAELAAVARDFMQLGGLKQVCDRTDNTGNWFIYCSGNILAAMNVHKIEDDSKTFVDRPLKDDPRVIQAEFDKEFGNQTIGRINPLKLVAFRDRYFGTPGTELEVCKPPGWVAEPPKIARIKDEKLKNFALFLHNRWNDLCRRIKPIKDKKRNSLIEVPEPFIVPGGRFREFYYWDAYWIVKGLIASGLTEMVKNMVTNFIHCVKRFGFVPNGGRIYYLRRSQPPFLIPMAYEYFEATKDVGFIGANFDHLCKEFEFWMNERSTEVSDRDGNHHTLYLYRTESNVPRPESYRVDMQAAFIIENRHRKELFQNIASAAESGWDFSSRWFADRLTMQTIETTNVLPVDLNAILCWNANILKYFADILGREQDKKKFEDRERAIWHDLNTMLYNKSEKAWFDYNIRTESHNIEFYPSMAMPLFAGCYPALDNEKSAKIIDFMKRVKAFDYKSGVPTSLAKNVGQQWDFPNGWSPLQHIIIEGMRKSDNPDAQEIAYKLARKWVLANYAVYQKTKHMWEKLDVVGRFPKPGAGGEYDAQTGFGWTNGVILDLLATYYNRMTLENETGLTESKPCDYSSGSERISFSWISIILILFSITLSRLCSTCI